LKLFRSFERPIPFYFAGNDGHVTVGRRWGFRAATVAYWPR